MLSRGSGHKPKAIKVCKVCKFLSRQENYETGQMIQETFVYVNIDQPVGQVNFCTL